MQMLKMCMGMEICTLKRTHAKIAQADNVYAEYTHPESEYNHLVYI